MQLVGALARGRRAGLIDWSAIRDDGVDRYKPKAWAGAASFKRAVAEQASALRLDRQDGQPVRIWLMCEAAGMAPMLARAADPYGVPVIASGGFDSLTAKHDLARELRWVERAEVLHVGDHDPSGVHLFTALAEDVIAFVRHFGGPDPTFTRLAVTPDQIAALSLPTAPPKPTDKRKFEGETVQAEAIPPDVLTAIVISAIVSRQDAKIRDEMLAREQAVRAELAEWVGRAVS